MELGQLPSRKRCQLVMGESGPRFISELEPGAPSHLGGSGGARAANADKRAS